MKHGNVDYAIRRIRALRPIAWRVSQISAHLLEKVCITTFPMTQIGATLASSEQAYATAYSSLGLWDILLGHEHHRLNPDISD
jgi:hypothetical protein